MSEHAQELNPTEPPASLEERVARLEKTLDQVVLLMSDTFRYGKLRELLEAKNWREADLETTRVMLEIANQPKHDNLKPDEVMLFPCSALHLLDQLWLKYSNNQFGFSVQRRIYTEAGGTDDISNIDLDLLARVGDRLGWREEKKWLPYEQLNFSLSAPPGCHPSNWWRSAYGAKMAVYFLARLMRCGV
ncbi:GUN4 domain-containing protein [Lyngbya sp. CCY1209]|uniref:GUN4 domain-containing protein n=1 Tax=Lyngbya sp. CCY1209 TaxID=2886103 RepID=UPI002D217DF9|nr:GUN4 domain-containing protein [Lyngbya sp. CCY1209]MEB3883405.1 GUN4 domain-containing protein [Lyngbya sp. CCY1209]